MDGGIDILMDEMGDMEMYDLMSEWMYEWINTCMNECMNKMMNEQFDAFWRKLKKEWMNE